MKFARVVITGAKGQLGQELCRILGRAAIPADLPEVDITSRQKLWTFLREASPEAIINAAAFTRVDLAEELPDEARAVNVLGVRHLAEYCLVAGIPLVQVSTDYVFGGDWSRSTPYREEDPPSPVNVYGQTKLEGEKEAMQTPRHVIVRTCGLYGELGPLSPGNFVETILRKAREQRVLRVVNDQVCCPSYVPHVARALVFLLARGHSGLFHVVNGGGTTWFEFARAIVRRAGLDAEVVPISSSEYPARARRPRYSVLDCSKFLSLPGAPPLPSWQEALEEYLAARRQKS
ncbi:MAG: dTDP-4-dehydrorhamnose reductase [Thermoguttaceae bacterium]|nr:dTDP-4-dehydrorhamnose reductase [Thermoguttaceae bacterium]MDW8078667.1 dTDP-4-dehydrorhamnose reductase [Thermoguttaceae bacterium]